MTMVTVQACMMLTTSKPRATTTMDHHGQSALPPAR